MKRLSSVTYLPPADRDLEEIFDYIRIDSPSRASRFLPQFDRSISRIGRFPLSGTVPRDPFLKQKGYRILCVGNYLVFYRTQKRRVVVYRILHGKRKYSFLL